MVELVRFGPRLRDLIRGHPPCRGGSMIANRKGFRPHAGVVAVGLFLSTYLRRPLRSQPRGCVCWEATRPRQSTSAAMPARPLVRQGWLQAASPGKRRYGVSTPAATSSGFTWTPRADSTDSCGTTDSTRPWIFRLPACAARPRTASTPKEKSWANSSCRSIRMLTKTRRCIARRIFERKPQPRLHQGFSLWA